MDFYRHCRATVSLLISEGHTAARHYPLAYMWAEARFAIARQNSRMSTEASLMLTVITAAISDGKPMEKALRRLAIVR